MKRTYSILLGTLLATLIVAPITAAANLGGDFVEIMLFASLATAAIGAAPGRTRNWLFVMMAGAGALRVAGRVFDIRAASDVAAVAWLLLASVAAIRAVGFALGSVEVDVEHICAALSFYMLAGNFYALAYWKLDRTWPGSFANAGLPELASSIYFSFVTLATVGYGDIVPVSPVARGLAVTESVLGQFYMVVLVARLVSLYSQRPGGKE